MSSMEVQPDGVTVDHVDPATCSAELDAAAITEPGLRHDYTYCRALLDHHGKSYALATTMLPPSKRPFVWALYGFARYADEFVDSLTDPHADKLEDWGTGFLTEIDNLHVGQGVVELTDADLTKGTVDTVSRAMAHTMGRWNLPVGTVEAFLDSMLMDISVTEYATYQDLNRYMYGSAAVIGLQMFPVLGSTHSDAPYHAAQLGEAFQLTNFIRDVAEDSLRGRCYIPVEVLNKHDITVADVHEAREAGRTPGRLRSALRDMAEHTEQVYTEAAPGVGMLHPTSRHGIQCAFRLYRQILHDVAAIDFDVLGQDRVVVPQWRRMRYAAPAVTRAWLTRRTMAAPPYADSPGTNGTWTLQNKRRSS